MNARTALPAFDNRTLDTAAESAVQALAALQQALSDADGHNPLTIAAIVQLAAAATGLSMLSPITTETPRGAFSPKVQLKFVIVPNAPSLATLELNVPAIGPDGTAEKPTAEPRGLATHAMGIRYLRKLHRVLAVQYVALHVPAG